MASYWIKMRVDLDQDLAVNRMALILGMQDLDVIGRLWKVWSWADRNLSEEQPTAPFGSAWLDKYVGTPGFAKAMEQVGWLDIVPKMSQDFQDTIRFPSFSKHMGAYAKKRADETRRKQEQRSVGVKSPVLEAKPHQKPEVSQFCPKNVPESLGQNPGPEEEEDKEEEIQSEEERKPPSIPPGGANLKFNALEVELPHKSDEFRTSWREWVAHRSELRKPLKPTSTTKQLQLLAGLSEAEAIAQIEASIRGNWQGLFAPPKNAAQGGSNGHGGSPGLYGDKSRQNRSQEAAKGFQEITDRVTSGGPAHLGVAVGLMKLQAERSAVTRGGAHVARS